MITMTNVLRRGCTVWDRALLPDDEYSERVRVLRAGMREEDLGVLVCLGHATRPGMFTYVSGYVPPLGWMGTVLGAEQGPVLVSGGGSREVPFVRTQTWIDDLRTSRSLFTGPAEIVAAAVDAMIPGGRVGIAGAEDALTPATRRELAAALSDYDVVDADELVASARAVKRPRERLALQRALGVAWDAVDAGVQCWRDGGSDADALLAAEKVGRLGGCRDVMVLGSSGGRQLVPLQSHSDERSDQLTVYCTLERRGYWGQACASTAPATQASAAVEAMIEAAAPGVDAGELARAALDVLPDDAAAETLAYGLGGGIGLDPSERPEITPAGGQAIEAGAVLALQAIVRQDGTLTGAAETILVSERGATRL